MDQLEKSKAIAEYKATLEGKSLEELKAIEQEIIKEADAIDEKVSKTVYKLETKGYKETAEAIQYFLNKQTVQWQYSLGMATMYETWNPESKPKTVAYAVLDSTLRTIGAMQFTGYEEWTKVIAINKYFESVREEYSKLTASIYDVADRHSSVMDAMNAVGAIENGLGEENVELPSEVVEA